MVTHTILHKHLNLLPRQKTFLKKFTEDKSLKSEVNSLKQILSKEKINTLYMIKHKKPESIYELSKLLNKDFKTVYKNVMLLKDYGLVSLEKVKKGKRISMAPVLLTKRIDISMNI